MRLNAGFRIPAGPALSLALLLLWPCLPATATVQAATGHPAGIPAVGTVVMAETEQPAAQAVGALSPAGISASYTAPFFTSSSYDPAAPTVESILGFEPGSRPVHHDELWRYLEALAQACPRVRIEEHGRTYEGRRLAHLIITSPENQARMEEIRRDQALLADPRRIQPGQVDALVARTPAVCWLGCSIHGNELSGVDAALCMAYELAASRDTLTQRLLSNLVILIDPCQNPDGRERTLSQVAEWSGALPDPDDQALNHAGAWPGGRGNHYLFDLNRDWLTFVQPESRGRVQTLAAWNPQLVVDEHEMSGLDTYLFSPPREPYNPNMTASSKKWSDIFAAEQATAFDQHGWSYYTGEWNEEWYPGYGSSRARYTGAVGILYEEAGVTGSLIKQPNGRFLTYRETVHHQLVSSLANITTAARHRAELLREFQQERASAVESGKNGPMRAFYLLPDGSGGRADELARVLADQGIEVGLLPRAASVTGLHAEEQGRPLTKALPAGTYVVSLAQPLGMLARALMEFDPRMDRAFLQSERRELEARGRTRLYESTAWSLPLAYGVEAYWSGTAPPAGITPLGAPAEVHGTVENPRATYGYLIDGASDASMKALASLLQQGIQVRVARKPFRIEGQDYPRGSFLIRRLENGPGLDGIVALAAAGTGVTIRGVSTAKSDERPDLGGQEFRLLQEPRPALLAGQSIDASSFGALWWMCDRDLSLRVSPLDVTRLADEDLSKYNVLILPACWGGADGARRSLGDRGLAKIRTWVEDGGTFIAMGGAAAFAADSTSKLSAVRERGQVLGQLEIYRRALEREQASEIPVVDSLAVWDGIMPAPAPSAVGGAGATGGTAGGGAAAGGTASGGIAAGGPAAGGATAGPSEEKKPTADLKLLEEEDRRGRLFRPQGTILLTELDGEHWLTAGLPPALPVMIEGEYAFLSQSPVETPARMAPAAQVRISGLLWPEARARLGGSAYLTREARGKGQIILFAGEPQFRAQFRGSMRLLDNAILLGPGMGVRNSPPW